MRANNQNVLTDFFGGECDSMCAGWPPLSVRPNEHESIHISGCRLPTLAQGLPRCRLDSNPDFCRSHSDSCRKGPFRRGPSATDSSPEDFPDAG